MKKYIILLFLFLSTTMTISSQNLHHSLLKVTYFHPDRFLINLEELNHVQSMSLRHTDYHFTRENNTVEFPPELWIWNNGMLVQYHDKNFDSDIITSIQFIYDDNNFLVEYIENGKSYYFETLIENENKVILKEAINTQGNSVGYIYYYYDNIIHFGRKEIEENEVISFNEIIFIFDENNRLIERREITRMNYRFDHLDDICFIYKFKYNDNNTIHAYTGYRTNQFIENINTLDEFQIREDSQLFHRVWDYQNDKISMIKFYKNDSASKFLYYKFSNYDNYGNWLEATCWIEAKLLDKYEREIEYFE